MRKRSFRKINDAIDALIDEGIDAPLTDEDGEWWNSDLVVSVQDEFHAELAERLNALEIDRNEKMESIAYKLDEMNADVEDLTNQIRRLTQWRDAIRNRHDWLKKYTAFEMMRIGLNRFVGRFTRMWVRQSPISATYAETEDKKPKIEIIDPRFVTEVVTYKVDKQEAIRLHREALKHYEKTGEIVDGYEIQGFDFETENKHLVYDKPSKKKDN